MSKSSKKQVRPIEDTFKKLHINLNNKPVEVTVVSTEYKEVFLTEEDKVMDRRFEEAVKEAIADRKDKGFPIARYDGELKKAYLEMPDGAREYIG